MPAPELLAFLAGAAFFAGTCESADPAADLEVEAVRPSRSVFEAAEAAEEVVAFRGFTCDRALPAAALDVLPTLGLQSVFAADLATDGEVTFVGGLLAITAPWLR